MKRTLLLLLFGYAAWGQTNKRYVEEIALYHLDSLTKIDTIFKNFKYFTNGYLTNSRTGTDTTMWGLGSIKSNCNLKSLFKNLQLVEDTNILYFSVPKKLRKNGSSATLNIFRFSKINNKYLVRFGIPSGEGGLEALIIMNNNGDLVGRKYWIWIE